MLNIFLNAPFLEIAGVVFTFGAMAWGILVTANPDMNDDDE